MKTVDFIFFFFIFVKSCATYAYVDTSKRRSVEYSLISVTVLCSIILFCENFNSDYQIDIKLLTSMLDDLVGALLISVTSVSPRSRKC
jgi:hypothetical protein